MTVPGPFRLGVFTRLVDLAPPDQVYARALRLFETAERLGYDVGWVAQHHAHNEGGLPSPLVFLPTVRCCGHRRSISPEACGRLPSAYRAQSKQPNMAAGSCWRAPRCVPHRTPADRNPASTNRWVKCSCRSSKPT